LLRRSDLLVRRYQEMRGMRVKFGAVESRPYLQNKQSRRILEAARDIFIREGATAFSSRRVAKAAKLSLGSVQHVFPTTDELVTAMLEHVNDGYEAAYRTMAERLPFSAEQRLAALLDYLLEDICRPDTRKFWFGFWALSCHNAHGASLLREAYRRQCNNVAGFLGAARPELSDAECLRLSTHINALIEGMMLFTGMAEKPLTLKSPLISGLRARIWSMIDADSSTARAKPTRSSAVVRDRKGRASAREPESVAADR
jgi:TetR/AcrR family transcriptional regulator, cholesterol catabolism regulator